MRVLKLAVAGNAAHRAVAGMQITRTRLTDLLAHQIRTASHFTPDARFDKT